MIADFSPHSLQVPLPGQTSGPTKLAKELEEACRGQSPVWKSLYLAIQARRVVRLRLRDVALPERMTPVALAYEPGGWVVMGARDDADGLCEERVDNIVQVEWLHVALDHSPTLGLTPPETNSPPPPA